MIVRKLKKPLSSPAPTRGRISALIIEARYYDDIANELLHGAVAELEANNVSYDRLVVPGALEIPLALSQAVAAHLLPKGVSRWRWCGVVALGCVIRGETSHYDIVCYNAHHWLMEVATRNAVPLGNGILTVDSKEQGMVRAQGGRKGKGGEAARAFLKVLESYRIFQDCDHGEPATKTTA